MGMPAHAFPKEDQDDINDTPTIQEYKKLRRVMRVMIRFYETGSQAKLDQAQDMEYELGKVESDLHMVESQLDALKPFPIHPKRTAYEEELNEERKKLVDTQTSFRKKLDNFRKLYDWSLGIVDVTKWLFEGLDDYCVNYLKMDLGIEPKPLVKPSLEIFKKYKEGLDEVTYNLQESQDFFSASIDGRLRKYHQIEKDIIVAQLEAIERFPPINPRKAHVEEELRKDLEFLEGNMKEDPTAMGKRERMLTMHRDFCKVLEWFQKKAQVWTEEYGLEFKELPPDDKASPNVVFMRTL